MANTRPKQSPVPTVRDRLGRLAIPDTPRAGMPRLRAYADPRRVGILYGARGQNDYALLYKALSDIVPRIWPAYQAWRDYTMEKEMAAGQLAFDENETPDKNQIAFDQYEKDHPEHNVWNPWREAGYERARLKNLAIDASQKLGLAYTEQGMATKGFEEVQKFMDDFYAQYKKNSGLDDYQNKIRMAQVFSRQEAMAKQQLGNAHAQNMAREQVKRFKAETSDLFRDNILTGGMDIQQAIAQLAQDMQFKGLRESDMAEVVVNGLAGAYNETNNDKYIEAIKNTKLNGVSLMGMPGVADKIHAIERRALREARADAQFGWAAQRQADYNYRQNVLPAQALQAIEAAGGKQVSYDDMRAAGIPEQHVLGAMSLARSYNQSVREDPRQIARDITRITHIAERFAQGDITEYDALLTLAEHGSQGISAWKAAKKDLEQKPELMDAFKYLGNVVESLFPKDPLGNILNGMGITGMDGGGNAEAEADMAKARIVSKVRPQLEAEWHTAFQKGRRPTPQAMRVLVDHYVGIEREAMQAKQREAMAARQTAVAQNPKVFVSNAERHANTILSKMFGDKMDADTRNRLAKLPRDAIIRELAVFGEATVNQFVDSYDNIQVLMP